MKLSGKKVKMKRIELDLTQAQLAERCEIATGTLSGIEKKSKSPNFKILLRIAQELQCNIEEFLKES